MRQLLTFFVIIVISACALNKSDSTSLIDSPTTTNKLPAEFVDNNGFVRSPNDGSSYRSIVLENGLEVLLIQNDFPRAGVSLDLKVGSADNPKDYPGLAHFLEHMLFLGTEKYPQADDYQDFIRTNGGNYNATTGLDHTNYFFTIDGSKLAQGMDRLAQFFIAPLFNRDYVDRELEIIQAEYARSLDNEGRALYFAGTRLYNPQHPASRFTTGNSETLLAQGREPLYQALRSFYNSYYRPDKMRLVVVGNQPLDKLVQLTQTTFGAIAAQTSQPLPSRPKLYKTKSLPVIQSLQSNSERYSLTYSFPIPSQSEHRFSKPATYLSHLIGHEAPGTLLSWLKQRDWANSLSAGSNQIGDEYTFSINIGLTREGNKHIDAIHQAVFAWIDTVKKTASSESWRYSEMQTMGNVLFRWREASDPLGDAISISRAMHYVPVKQIFQQKYLYSGFNPKQVEQILGSLTPNRVAIKHVSPDPQTDLLEPLYQIKYRINSLGEDFIKLTQNTGEVKLKLPGANPYIPTKLSINKVASGKPYLVENPQVYAWLYKDAKFGVPQANINLSVSMDEIVKNPTNRLLLRIYKNAKQNQLQEQFYSAQIAGLGFKLYDHLRGITLRVSGYDRQISLLFNNLLQQAMDWELSQQEFEKHKTRLQISINNHTTRAVLRRLSERMVDNRMAHQLDYQQTRKAVANMQYSDWLKLHKLLTKKPSERTLLIHGEINEQQAAKIISSVASHFPSRLKQVNPPAINPVDGPQLVAEPVYKDQTNQALMYVYANLKNSPRNHLLANLAGDYLASPFFHFMRTEHQLGYQASATGNQLLDNPQVVMFVESAVAQPPELHDYFQQFFAMMRQRLPDDATFELLGDAMASRLSEPVLRSSDETAIIWVELFYRNYKFDTREQKLAELKQLQATDLREFIETLLSDATKANQMWGYSGDGLKKTEL